MRIVIIFNSALITTFTVINDDNCWDGVSQSNLPPEVNCPPGASYFEVNRPPLKLFAPLPPKNLAQRTLEVDPVPTAGAAA